MALHFHDPEEHRHYVEIPWYVSIWALVATVLAAVTIFVWFAITFERSTLTARQDAGAAVAAAAPLPSQTPAAAMEQGDLNQLGAGRARASQNQNAQKA